MTPERCQSSTSCPLCRASTKNIYIHRCISIRSIRQRVPQSQPEQPIEPQPTPPAQPEQSARAEQEHYQPPTDPQDQPVEPQPDYPQPSTPTVPQRRYSQLQEEYFRWSSSFISFQVRKGKQPTCSFLTVQAPVQKKQENITEQVEVVAGVFPSIPREIIMRSLRATNSVPQTIENFLQSRWVVPNPAVEASRTTVLCGPPSPLSRTYSGDNFRHVAVA